MNRTGGDADSRLAIASIASAAAGVLHATAAGIHADHPELARLFVVLTIAQVGVAVWGFVRPGRLAAAALAAVNAIALAGWVATRITGISWISGLESAERPQPADTIAAVFAAVALLMAVVSLARRMPAIPSHTVTVVAVAAGLLVVPGLVNATNHDHAGHDHTATAAESDLHDHGTDGGAATGAAAAATELVRGRVDADDRPRPRPHDHRADGQHGGHAGHGPGSRPAPPLRPDLADRPRRGPRRHAPAAGVRREPRRRRRFATCRSGPTRPSPRRPVSARSATPSPVTSTTSSGTGSTTTCGSIPTTRRASCSSRNPTARRSSCRRCSCCPSGYTARRRAGLGRGADAVAHPRRPVLHRRRRRPAGRQGSSRSAHPARRRWSTSCSSPMIHVWITPTPCGPFAALEGIGGGQVPEGEDVLCDHVHGAP